VAATAAHTGSAVSQRVLQRTASVLMLAALSFALSGPQAQAQQVTDPAAQPPPIPPGEGVVSGRVVHPSDPSRTAGIPVVLYGLSRAGDPGLANTRTDAGGAFRFEGVSNDETMAYLVGAKYGEIPFFGPSASFETGATELEVRVDINDPTPDATGISVAEVIVQVEWVGGGLAVQELHRVQNESGSVVRVQDTERNEKTPAPFVAQLPSNASDFLPVAMGFEDAFDESDGRVRFWGPIYPGGQDVRFQYLLPVREGETPIALRLPMGSEQFTVLTASDGPVIADSGGLVEDADVELDGRNFSVLRTSSLAPGAEIVIAVGAAITSDDTSRLTMPRADLWLELDDAQLVTTHNIEFEVEGGERLASAGDEPLLRFPLPRGSELLDMSPETRALGIKIQQEADRTVAEVRGPIPPGESAMRLRYRVPTSPEGVTFTLSFPRDIQTLNVLVADTGVEIETDRLHRRRPFRQGTRIYLHREAFQIEASESLEIGLRPLVRNQLGPTTSMAAAIAGIGLSLLFLLAPLRTRTTSDEGTALNELAAQRDAIYQDILDLDHDFETGKLDAADHAALRAELRARAAALLGKERSAVASPPAATNCPDCGLPIEAAWTFCSKCGARLEGVPEATP